MSDRGLLRVLIGLLGVGFGVAAVVIVVLTIGALPTQATPTPVATTTTGRPASTTGAQPAPLSTPVAAPTAPAGVVEVNGLAEMRQRASSLRGKPVRVTIGESELTELAADYIQRSEPQGVDITNVQARLRPGQVILAGNARQAIVGTDFSVTGHPVVSYGGVELRIDSVEPSLIARLGGIAPGQGIAVPISNFEARSVDVVEGQMVVTGTVK